MDWLERYINKRTAELHQQITKSKWQQSNLESTLTKLHNQHPHETDNRVGEIPLRREISTSHTTVRTVPYTAVQST